MERRALLAALLSGVVMILWFALFAPQRPPVGTGRTPAARWDSTPVSQAGERRLHLLRTATSGSCRWCRRSSGRTPARSPLEGEGWHGLREPEGGRADLADPLRVQGRRGRAARAGPSRGFRRRFPWGPRARGTTSSTRSRAGAGGSAAVERRQGELGGEEAERRGGEVRARGRGARRGRAGERRGGGGDGSRRRGSRPTSRDGSAVAGAVVRVGGEGGARERRRSSTAPQTVRGAVDFAGVEDQYFLVVLLPSGGLEGVQIGGCRSRAPEGAETTRPVWERRRTRSTREGQAAGEAAAGGGRGIGRRGARDAVRRGQGARHAGRVRAGAGGDDLVRHLRVPVGGVPGRAALDLLVGGQLGRGDHRPDRGDPVAAVPADPQERGRDEADADAAAEDEGDPGPLQGAGQEGPATCGRA